MLSVLNISTEKLYYLLGHKCGAPKRKFPPGYCKYHLSTIMGRIAYYSTIDIFQHLLGIVGEDMFCKGVFMRNGWGNNTIQNAIKRKRIKMIKYLLNIEAIKETLLKDDYELGLMIKTVNNNFDASIVQCVVNKLELTDTKLIELNKSYGIPQILSYFKIY